MGLLRNLHRTYFSIDPRSLGLFRVLFASALLFDLFGRYRDLDSFYTNAGLLPNHTLLWAPPTRRMFSLFFTASTHAEAAFGMALCALCFSLLLVGYRTKLMQILSWICLISLNTRLCLLENGGDVALNHLATWTLPLPLGRRFSLDALLASLRAREEHDADELRDRSALRPADRAFRSIAVLGVILQLFVIYLFNTLHKNGVTWHSGSAVQLVLHQDRLVTAFGVFLREHAPSSLLRDLSFATLYAESLGAALVISPLFAVTTRALAIAIMPLLHLGFALCLDLGVFSFAMIAFYPLLLHERHWNWFARRFAPRGPRLRCFFDADCGFCFLVVRILARLDPFTRIEFIPNHAEDRLPRGVDAELVQRTVVAENVASGKIFTRSDAIAEVCRALPCGFPAYVVLKLPGLRFVWLRLYERVAENRVSVSQFLGLAACGVPQPARAVELASPDDHGTARLKRRAARVFGELFALTVLVAAVGETLNYNAAVPAALHYRQPEPLQALIDYGRLIQNWRMFAPEVPDHDAMISVEATTADGRLVDPYNEVASRYHGPFNRIPPRLGNDQFFDSYVLLLPDERAQPYWNAFEEWILAYPQRTGRKQDRIQRYTAYVITDRSPPLGRRKPTDTHKEVFLTWPRP